MEKGFRSISIECFAEVLELLIPMIRADGVPEPLRGYNSEHLKAFLAKKGLFLPSFYDKKFSLDTPDIVVTYMWLGTTVRELLAILRQIAAGRNCTVWVDVVFNDQRSPQVPPRDPDSRARPRCARRHPARTPTERAAAAAARAAPCGERARARRRAGPAPASE